MPSQFDYSDDCESSPGVHWLVVRGADRRRLLAISLTAPSGRCTEERLDDCVREMPEVVRALRVRVGGAVTALEAVG